MSAIDSNADVGLAQAIVVGGANAPRRGNPPPLPQADRSTPSVAPPVAKPAGSSTAWLWWSWLALPSWLISAIVHLVAMIGLALATVPEKHDAALPVLTVEISEGIDLQSPTELELTPPGDSAADLETTSISEMLADAQLSSVADPIPNASTDSATGSGAGVALDIGGIDEMLGGGGGGGMQSLGGGGPSAEFFGIKAGGRKFVFIVDSSNSMRGRRFRDAKQEVLKAVRRLDKTQSFYVIFFDEDADRMFSGPGQEPEPRPLLATSENIRRLEKWIPTVELEFRTDPYEAVKYAVEMRPDAIYLLSDGQFTDGGKTEEYLAANNLFNHPELGYQPRVVIHTIAFHSREGEPTMQEIAKKYGGTYRFVPSSK